LFLEKMMAKRPLAAGDNVESRCTRCRVVTNHIIVAMVGERVVRVQCNTCNGVHNFHSPAVAAPRAERKTPAAAAEKRPRASRGTNERDAWLAAGGDADPAQAAAYDMNRPFKVAERLRHPIFGMGVVTAVAPGKMEVLFEGGRKLLRCGR
jgi:hypothetical protein